MTGRKSNPPDIGNLRGELRYRRQVSLEAGFNEVTSRLVGLVEWMRSVPVMKRLLRQLRREGAADAIMYEKSYGRTYLRKPLQVRRIEDIAAIGLELVDLADKGNQPLYKIGSEFGIGSDRWNAGSDADSAAVISRYVIPFLDYIEQRLPQPEGRVLRDKQLTPPAVIVDSLKKFNSEHRKVGGRCFIMMRFGKTGAHNRIERAIKASLSRHGLIGLLARDKDFHEDLYPNILTYMHGCDFGIAVFERLESDVFNPNVSLEVGYMLALKKHVLLLKDRTLHALHTDLVGKLYREFDPQRPTLTIPLEIDKWLSDKGLA